MLGPLERPPVAAAEQEAIDSLRRGVYAREEIGKGSPISRDQVFFAMPYVDGQLETGRWKEGMVATEDVAANGPLLDSMTCWSPRTKTSR